MGKRGMKPGADLTGQTFGQLTVVERCDYSGNGAIWRCRCRCGMLKDVRATQLRNGNVKSCGCLMREAGR